MRRLPTLLLVFVLAFSVPVPARAEPVKIGFTLPASGPFAEFGVSAGNALRLAQEDRPDLFRLVQFIVEDDQYDPKTSVTAFQKLKEVDHAALILAWGNEPALALSPIAERQQFPLIAFGQTPSIASGKRYVVRVLSPASEFGSRTAEYLLQERPASVQMVLVENTFYRLVAESLERGLGGAVPFNIAASVPAAEQDFKPHLLKLQQNPEAMVGVFLAPAQVISFFKQANAIGLKNRVFGSTSFESQSVIQGARQFMDGALYVHVNVDPDWHAKYLTRFKNDIQVSYAAVAYDVATSLAKIVQELGTGASGAEILARFGSMSVQKGASGEFRSKETPEDGRYIAFEVVAKRISGGKATVISR